MPKVQNLFINGRSDSDTNYALLDNKSHVYVENMRISGDGDDGSFKSLKGSQMVSDQYSDEGSVIIREYEGINNKLYYCLANINKQSSIVEYDTETGISKLIIEDSQFLRFDMIRWDEDGNLKDAPYEYLLSFNQIGNFLIFSSKYWQYPRMVNLKRIADYASGFTEEDIVLIKKPPKDAPVIADKYLDEDILDEELKNKFVSASYRYKYIDGDYSTLSFFSDAMFWQDSDHFQIEASRKNLGMENDYNKVKLNVNSGGKTVTNVEVYVREHGSNTAYLIQSFDKKKQGITDNATLDVFYTFSTKYEVLNANATNLLFSNCPMFPIGQENVGNREIFANYMEGFDLKDKDGEDVLVDYKVINKQSDFSESEQNRTAISLFSYKVAPVFYNDYNISSTALLPTDQTKSEVFISFQNRLKRNNLEVEFSPNFKAPAFATKLKFVVKSELLQYEIAYLTYGKKVGKYTYLQLTNDNVNRINKGDTLIVISENETEYNEVKVEDYGEYGPSDGVDIKGNYIKIKDDDRIIELEPNGSTITKNYKEDGTGVQQINDYYFIIDFVYGSTDTRRFDATSGYAGVNSDEGWNYSSINNRGHLLKSDFGVIKEGDVVKWNINFQYAWAKSGGTFSTNGMGNINLSKEMYASKDYTNIFEFLQDEFDEPLITLEESGDYVWFKTNYLFPNYVKDSGIQAYLWSPNDGGSQAAEALAVKPTTDITLIRGIKPVVVRTKQVTLENDGEDSGSLYYETHKTYNIVNGEIIPDRSEAGKLVFEIDFYNGYTWGNGIESYKIRDEFNGKRLNFNFRPNTYDINGYKAIRKENDICYSGLYNYELNINQLSTFNPVLLNWKTLPSNYGPIQRLLSSDNNITVYCTNKVMLVMYEKSIIMDLLGNENVATSNQVLGDVITIDYECGIGNNPESLVSVGNAHLFCDPIRKRVYLKQGREIQELSGQGTGCFNEFVKILSAHKTFLGAFDDARGEYLIGVDQDFSIAYSLARKGIAGYYKNHFDYLFSMNGKSFTGWQGKLYQNEVTNDYNNFAGQGSFPAKIIAVVNPEMDSDKVFKALYLQSNTGWDTEIRTNLTKTSFPESAYTHKESFYYSEIFRDNTTLGPLKGVGVIKEINGNQLVFSKPINNTIAVNDTLVNDNSQLNSKITGINKNIITVESASDFAVGDYTYCTKIMEGGYRPDGIPMRGQWMEFTLTKIPDKEIFLTSVYTEVIKSNL